MQKNRWFVFAVTVVLGVSVMAGQAMALMIFTAGGQSALPVARPAIGVYTLPVTLNAADTWDWIFVGRDDTSPFAGVRVTPAAAPAPIVNGVPTMFVYRPLWDVAEQPNIPAVPAAGQYTQHFTPSDIFATHATTVRANLATGAALHMWLDPGSIGTGALNDTEFYKYYLGW
jgi:hypothetical protein